MGSKSPIQWGAEHSAGDGSLIVRMVSIDPPDPPTCPTFKCLWGWILDCLRYALILKYHKRRVRYAEENRNTHILERYRTGDRSPETILMAIIAHIKLTCPVCRRYETKYW